jgi:hypothetical protein
MTTPAPGWLPDPTGRHEYRYWDGGSWSSDVADAGVAAVDPPTAPLPAPGTPAVPPGPADPAGDPTEVIDGTAAYPPAPGPYGPPTAAFGSTPAAGAPPGGPPPAPGTAGYPPAPRRSGPSTGLLVGLAVLAVALIAGIVFALAGDDDDDGDAATGTTTTTAADDGDDGDGDDGVGGDDTTTVPDADGEGTLGDLGDDVDLDDPETREELVDLVADQLEQQGLDREQAECMADGVLDSVDAARLAEIGESGDMSSLTPDELSSLFSAVTDCGLTDVPGDDGGGP